MGTDIIPHETAPDRADLLALIERDPIRGAQACREQIKADDAGVHEQRRRRLAEGYMIANRLKADYALWQQFVADPFFDKDERIRKQDDTRFVFIVTRAVLIYLFSVLKTNNSMRNRIWRYARVIDHYDAQGVPPERMVEQIKADGGIEKISAGVGKDRFLEDEHRDWEAEMASRAGPGARVTHDVEEEDESPEESEDELQPAPTAYILPDEDVNRYLESIKSGVEVFLVATKAGVDGKGRTMLRVSEIDNLSSWGAGYKKAMREWVQHEEDEGYV